MSCAASASAVAPTSGCSSASRLETLAGPVTEHLLGLVIEPEQIVLSRRLLEEGRLPLHRFQRKEVERAHPVDFQEGTHEEEVAREDHRLLLVDDVHRLV